MYYQYYQPHLVFSPYFFLHTIEGLIVTILLIVLFWSYLTSPTLWVILAVLALIFGHLIAALVFALLAVASRPRYY